MPLDQGRRSEKAGTYLTAGLDVGVHSGDGWSVAAPEACLRDLVVGRVIHPRSARDFVCLLLLRLRRWRVAELAVVEPAILEMNVVEPAILEVAVVESVVLVAATALQVVAALELLRAEGLSVDRYKRQPEVLVVRVVAEVLPLQRKCSEPAENGNPRLTYLDSTTLDVRGTRQQAEKHHIRLHGYQIISQTCELCLSMCPHPMPERVIFLPIFYHHPAPSPSPR